MESLKKFESINTDSLASISSKNGIVGAVSAHTSIYPSSTTDASANFEAVIAPTDDSFSELDKLLRARNDIKR